jgi:ElaB/YqjD/DUF883 family membrane-anchored ribosome-binding protein
MKVHGETRDHEIELIDGDEIDTVRFAAFIRGHKIPWFDVANRELRSELRTLSSDLGSVLAESSSHPEARRVRLDRARSDLALRAMRWMVEHDDFSPDGVTGYMRQMLATVDTAGNSKAA